MANPYASRWMSGSDALAHVMKALDFDERAAFAEMQNACRDRTLKGREAGQAAEWVREYAADEMESAGTESAWRWWFIHQTPLPNRVCKSLSCCEFRREHVLALWPGNSPVMATPDLPTAQAHAQAPATRPASNRKTNGLNFNKSDAPLVDGMHKSIQAGQARSVEDAARMVVANAAGHGSPDSKVKRLAKHYRHTHPKPPVLGFE